MRSLAIFFLLFFLASCSSEDNVEQHIEKQPIQETLDAPNSTQDAAVLSDEDGKSLDLVEDDEIIENEEDASLEVGVAQDTLDKPAKEAISDKGLKNHNQINKIQGTEIKEVSNNDAISIPSYIIVLLVLFVATQILLAIVVSLLLKEVRWRKRHTKNESIIFPDAHLDILEDLKRAWENLYKEIVESTKLGLSNQKENENLANKTIDSVSKFNSTIDAQQAEINRLKEGYDFSIKKHSALALIEINDLVESYLAENTSDKEYEKLSKVDGYVKSNLEDLDIEAFGFEAGLSIRDLSPDEFEIDLVEKTLENQLHEKIKETTKKGYAFIHANGKNIIRKAKLKVYKQED